MWYNLNRFHGRKKLMRKRTNLLSTKMLAVCGLAALAGCGTCKKELAAETEETLPIFFTGKIADSAKYEGYHPRFAKAFAFMRRPDLASLKPGRYEIDGDNMWAMIQEAKLTPFGDVQRTEVHGKYIDIQAPIDGPETIGLLKLDPKERAALDFDEAKDYALFDRKTRAYTFLPGDFGVFVPPYGAHAPCKSLDGATHVKKLVIKVRK